MKPRRVRSFRRLAPGVLLLAIGCPWLALDLSVVEEAVVLLPTLIGCGIACSIVAVGWRAPLLGWRAATAPLDAVRPRQVVALQHVARGATIAGITIGALAVLMLFARFGAPDAGPAQVAALARWSLLAPLLGVWVGRVAVGSMVDALGATQLAADRSTLFGAVAIGVVAFVALGLTL